MGVLARVRKFKTTPISGQILRLHESAAVIVNQPKISVQARKLLL